MIEDITLEELRKFHKKLQDLYQTKWVHSDKKDPLPLKLHFSFEMLTHKKSATYDFEEDIAKHTVKELNEHRCESVDRLIYFIRDFIKD